MLDSYFEDQRTRIDQTLDRLLPLADGPAKTVAEAMRYAVLGGGKRLRPILTLAAAEACGNDSPRLVEPASALEMLHTYSLVHDDLPAMDDDALRRGRPTVHRVFGVAEAILAGDALQTLAFETLAGRPAGSAIAERRLDCVVVLARCAGVGGMVGGQIADIEAESSGADIERVSWIHRHKTGALFAASAEIGAIHGGGGSEQRGAFARYGRALGLAFQIADDILDRTSTAEELGKTPGKDDQAGKATYPALFGVEDSLRQALSLVDEALDALRPLGLLSEPLEALVRGAVQRQS